MKVKLSWRVLFLSSIGFIPLLLSGCFDSPRFRMGCLPTPTFASRFLNPDRMGNHSYGWLGAAVEQDGILYTCKGGHVDMTHVRWTADYTKYLTKRTYKTLMKNKKGYSFNLKLELSTHVIRFGYPEDWESMEKEERERIANEIAWKVGPYLAYNSTIWHEFQTWYGVHFIGFEQEFNSAFSWEDSYSNLLGTHLALEAMRDEEHSFDKAMTLAINRNLAELDVVSRKRAIEISETVRDEWFTGNFVVDVTKRNFDIGLGDGYVMPTLVPGVSECEGVEAAPYPVHSLDVLGEYGFTMEYEIKPNVLEQGKMFATVGEKRICPEEHFVVMLDFLKAEADEKGYTCDGIARVDTSSYGGE